MKYVNWTRADCVMALSRAECCSEYGRTYWTKFFYFVFTIRYNNLANDHCKFNMIMVFCHDHVPKLS